MNIALKSSLCLIFFLVLAACPTDTGNTNLQLLDIIAPTVTISSHQDDDPYTLLLIIEGTVIDLANVSNDPGEVVSVSYEVNNGQRAGEVAFNDDGTFSIELSTSGITGTILIEFIATDWNGNSSETAINLTAPKELTYFAFLMDNNADSSLSEDCIGYIENTSILVSVPEGTAVTNLVADFVTTGTRVKVGALEQLSGISEVDFSGSVAYTVEANDNTLKQYIVEASAIPLPPSVLTCGILSAGQIQLSWSDNSTNEDGFEIERKGLEEENFTQIAKLSANIIDYIDDAFYGFAEYEYRVRSKNNVGASIWASALIDTVSPSDPSNLSLTNIAANSLSLSWDDNEPYETGYEIERQTGSSTFEPIADLPVNTTTYDDTTFSGSSNYTYRVRAEHNGAVSEWISLLVDVTPAVPTDLAVTDQSPFDIDITWNDTSTNETGFELQRKTGAEGNYVLVTTILADETSCSDTVPFSAVEYFYRVRAVNDHSASAWSNESSEITDRFTIETVVSSDTSGASIAVDSSGYPHIAYNDTVNKDLMYARWDGAAWQIEPVDSIGDVGSEASIKIDSSDYPHISYYDSTNGDLKYALWDGSQWQIETVDSAGDVGWCSSLALDSADNPHIGYSVVSTFPIFDKVKYAYLDGVWTYREVYDHPQNGRNSSIALDSNDIPHITFSDWSIINNPDPTYIANCSYTYWNGSSWQTPYAIGVHQSSNNVPGSIQIDTNDDVHISYGLDFSGDSVINEIWNGSSWTEHVLETGNINAAVSLVLDGSNNAHNSYPIGQLVYYTWWDGSAWIHEDADIGDGVIMYSAPIALDSSGSVHIITNDYTSGALIYLKDQSE